LTSALIYDSNSKGKKVMVNTYSFKEITKAIDSKSNMIVLVEDSLKNKIDQKNIQGLLSSGSDVVIGKNVNKRTSIFDLFRRILLFFPFSRLFRIKNIYPDMIAFKKELLFESDIEELPDHKYGIIGLLCFLADISKNIDHIEIDGPAKIKKDTKSKLRLIDIIKIRFQDKKTLKFLKFGTVGFFGYIVNASFLELFLKTGFTGQIAGMFSFLNDNSFLKVLSVKSSWSAGLSIEISIISNFIINNIWTFSAIKLKGIGNVIKKFFLFNFTSIGAVIIQFLVVGFATLIFGSTFLVRQSAVILSIVFLIIPYNWLMYNKIIWKIKK